MPLKGETLKGYNNLPAIPIEQPLGDLLNTIPVGDPSLESPAGNTVNLYVSASGSDDTGDGSQANPYATPQMAIDSIPATIEKDSLVQIWCGAGVFTFPDVSRVPSDIQCALVGDTSTPVLTTALGTSFPTVPGKVARRRGNVGAFAETITDGSHWGFLDFSSFGYAPSGMTVTASTSPDLDVVYGFDFGGSFELTVFAYSTVFEINPRVAFSGFDAEGPLGGFLKKVSLVGIEVKGYDSAASFKNFLFYGCKFSLGAGFFNVTFSSCQTGSYFEVPATFDGDSLVNNNYHKDAVTLKSIDSFTTAVVSGTITTSENAVFPAAGIDFEGSSDCFSLAVSCQLTIFGAITVEATKSTFIKATSAPNSSVVITGGTTITGSVTGNAITLVKGSQATGVENACNGTLTAGGSEIVVGGNVGQTFASLPATDLGAASPQLCRAD